MDESDESYDPILPDDLVPPKRASEPPPLQRLWKSPPEPEEVDEVEAAKAKKKKQVEEPAPAPKAKVAKPLFIAKKKKAEPVDDGTGAVKLEETPVLDTFEARQRARWLVGGLLAVIATVFVIIVIGAFKGDDNMEIHEGEPPGLQVVSTPPTDVEVEARIMLDNAKKADKLGKIQAAMNLLNRLFKAYPNTAAGREAQVAIERYRDNQPLFDNEGPQQASGPRKPPESGPKLATNLNPPPTTSGPSIAPTPPPATAKPADIPPKNETPTIPAAPVIAIKPLPSGYRANFDFPIHPSGWPTRLRSDRDGGELVLVPGGTFDMGRGDGEPQEGPVHRVSLSTYYIDLHEVTIRQYTIYLKESGRSLDVIKKLAAKSEDYPIVNVSSKEAKSFCDWAKRSLPTEAQWEMAARSTEGRISYWHGELPRPDPARGSRVMEPVMSLSSDLSAYGAYDMAANAWEWTSEYYDSQYYQQFRNLVFDPPGPKEPRTKIISMTVKGGSKSGILTWREGLKAETRLPYLGFRGALTVEVSPASAAANKPATPPPAAGPAASGGVQPF
jgi:formylglycine-generating enzyme